MKELGKQVLESHKKFSDAEKEWSAKRKELEVVFKEYANRKAQEIRDQYDIKDEASFTINSSFLNVRDGVLDAGSFSSFNIFNRKDNGDLDMVSYHPTHKKTWIRVTYDSRYWRWATEVEHGPVPIKVLEDLAKEMSEESGARFTFYLKDFTSEWVLNEYEKITWLDGSVYERPKKEEFDDEDECECN